MLGTVDMVHDLINSYLLMSNLTFFVHDTHALQVKLVIGFLSRVG